MDQHGLDLQYIYIITGSIKLLLGKLYIMSYICNIWMQPLLCLNILYFIILSPNRGLLEVLELDFVPKDISEQPESQIISWRLELPGNVKDVGILRIYTTQRDYVGLAPLVMVRTISVSV